MAKGPKLYVIYAELRSVLHYNVLSILSRSWTSRSPPSSNLSDRQKSAIFPRTYRFLQLIPSHSSFPVIPHSHRLEKWDISAFTVASGSQTVVALHSTLHSKLYTLHSTFYTLHSALYTLHFTLYTIYYTLYTMHSTLSTIHSTVSVYALHCKMLLFVWTMYSVNCKL